jgi:tRNA(Ile)-lysidine synthase
VSFARNRIRNRVFPELAAINPSFLQTFRREMRQFSQMEALLDGVFSAGRDTLCREQDGVLVIDIPLLRQQGQTGWWLYRLLEGYGFNADQLEQIERSLDGLSGKTFISATHRLVKDRRELRVYPLTLTPDDLTARLDVRTFTVTPGFNPKQKPEDVLFVDADLVRLPLSARAPRPGDRFRPFGMHAGSRLLSDFFTDLKLDVAQKEREIVVTSQNENGDEIIVAILGRRIDDRFKITAATRTVAAISFLPRPA